MDLVLNLIGFHVIMITKITKTLLLMIQIHLR